MPNLLSEEDLKHNLKCAQSIKDGPLESSVYTALAYKAAYEKQRDIIETIINDSCIPNFNVVGNPVAAHLMDIIHNHHLKVIKSLDITPENALEVKSNKTDKIYKIFFNDNMKITWEIFFND